MLGNFLLAVCLLVVLNNVKAQITINTLDQVYTQNFDSLGTNDVAWTNEVTIPDWLFVHSADSVNAGPINNLLASQGAGPEIISASPLNLGTDTDRALGSQAGVSLFSLTTNEYFYGVHFINATTATITNVTISYIGEQWFDAANTPETISFFYRIGGIDFLGDPSNAGWIASPNLNFTSIQNTGLGNTLDGNNLANRTNLVSDITVSIAPGEEFWIRWTDLEDPAGVSHILGIDDLSLTFTGIAHITNNALPNATNNILGVSLELKKPNPAKTLKFGQKGFKVKAWLSSTNTLTKASFATFASTNVSTNLTFTDFGFFKILTKGKLFKKKGVKAIAQTKGSGNKAGIGIAAGSSPITLVIKVDGTQGTNNSSASAFFTNVFTDVKAK